MNDEIKTYTTPSGKKRFKFTIYLGRDEKTGRPRQVRKQGYKSLRQAKKELLKIQVAVANGDYSPDKQKKLTFEEIYNRWLKIYAESVKESTLATTIRMVERHVLPSLGKYYIDRINVIQCQDAVNKWFKQAPKTYKKYLRYANKVFHYAMHLELIDSSPMDKVIRPKLRQEKKVFDQFYTKEELERYLAFAKRFKKEAFALFFTLAYTGLRKGEALALEWRDINLFNKTLSVRRTLSKGLNNRLIIQSPKTESSLRTIALTNDNIQVLKQWQEDQRKLMPVLRLGQDQFVFNGYSNGYPANAPLATTTIEVWNSKIAKKAHLRHIKIHGFRHTHASLLFDSGASMQDVKDRLGHKSIKTTMDIYTHLPKKRREKTMNEFSEYMAR